MGYHFPNILTSPTIQGTVKEGTGLTLPAHTTGLIAVPGVHFVQTGVTNSYIQLNGGTTAGGSGSIIALFGKTASGNQGKIMLGIPNAAGTANINRLIMTGMSDALALAQWASVQHTGLVLAGAMALNANNLVTDTTTGSKIGTATNQKLGFWNATPVVQQAHIVDADGTLADITTKFNNLLLKLETEGLLAAA